MLVDERHHVTTTSPSTRPTPAQSTAEDFAVFGPIHLDVTDLDRSAMFWRDLIGLQPLGGGASEGRREQRDGELRLGVEDAELVVLHAGARRPVGRGHTGLYHLAIHLPSEAEFARVLGRLFSARVPNAPTDHITHWATYLDDPDGIGLELSFETRDRYGRYDLSGPRPKIIDSQGRSRDGTSPLDLDEVFSHLVDRDLAQPMAPAARIGHIHLHVAHIEPALRFYSALGFTRGVDLPVGMSDMSAGGSFPHRLAVNVWQGVGAPPPEPGTAGLRHAVLRMRSQPAWGAALERVRELGGEPPEAGGQDGGVLVRDPSANRILLRSAAT
jgi:catechol 2,3-dioxygenase